MKCLVYASGAEKKAPNCFTSWRDNLNEYHWEHWIKKIKLINVIRS